MLGNHVDGSIKNLKLFKKILCVVLSILLVGFMIPNGVIQYKNAYANDEFTPTQEQTASEEFVDAPCTDPQDEENDISPLFGADDDHSFNGNNPSNGEKHIYFLTNAPDKKLPEGLECAWKVVNTWGPFDLPYNVDVETTNHLYKCDNQDDRVCCLYRYCPEVMRTSTYYGIKYKTDYAKKNYKVVKWQYSTTSEDGPYSDVTSDTLYIGLADHWFKLIIEPQVTFSSNLNLPSSLSSIDLYMQKSGETSLSKISLDWFNIYASLKTFKRVDAPVGFSGGLKVGDDLFCWKISSPDQTEHHRFIKWTYQKDGGKESDVSDVDIGIGTNVHFKAYFGTRLQFDFNAAQGSVAKVVSESNDEAHDFYLPGTTFGINDKNYNEFRVGEDIYRATPNDNNKFASWSLASGTLYDSTIKITANFTTDPQLNFESNLGDDYSSSGIEFFRQNIQGQPPIKIDLDWPQFTDAGSEFFKAESPYSGYTWALSVGSDSYCFLLPKTTDIDNYELEKWTFFNESGTELDIPSDHTQSIPIYDGIKFKAYFKVKIGFSCDSAKGSVEKISPTTGLNYGYYSIGTTFGIGTNPDEYVVGDDTYKAKPTTLYRFDNWGTGSGTLATDPVDIAANFTNATSFSFDTNFGEAYASTGFKFYKKIAGGNYQETDINASVDTEIGLKLQLVEPEQGYKAALKVGDTTYCFTFPASASDGYVFDKWTAIDTDGNETLITKEGINLGVNYTLKVYFKVGVSFSVNDANLGTINDKASVQDFFYPNTSMAIDAEHSNWINVGDKTYKAAAKTACEFINWSEIPSAINATPVSVIAKFATTPIIYFEIKGEDVASYFNIIDCETGLAYDITKSIPGLFVGAIYNVDPNDKTKIIINGKSYKANIINSHYVDFEEANYVWFIGNDHIGTEPVALEDGDDLTFSVPVKRIDNLKVSGTIKDSKSSAYLVGATYRYEVFIGNDMISSDVKTSSDGTFEIANLPHFCTVDVYADASKHNVHKLTVDVADTDKPEQPISLSEAYSFEYGGLVQGVWSDPMGFKTVDVVSGALTDTTQGYYVASDSGVTLKTKAMEGDNLEFASLSINSVVSGKTIKVGNQEAVAWDRYYSVVLNETDFDSEGYITIVLSANSDIDFISNTPWPRTVKFACDSAWKGTGTFDPTGPITLHSLYATASVHPTDKSKLIITDGDTSYIVTATANNTDNPSIFRQWNVEGTLKLADDTTITAKFVKANVNVTFIPANRSQFAKDSDDQTGQLGPYSIPMDSAFGYERTDSLTVNPFTQVGSDKTVIATMYVKDADKYKYKFADASFNPEAIAKISEEFYPDIETNGITIEYNIIQRLSKTIYLDYTEGASPGDQYTPPAIPIEYGSTREGGAWRLQPTNHRWVNYIYEEFPIKAQEPGGPALVNYFPKDWTNIIKDHDFFAGTWSGPSEGVVTEDTTWTANFVPAVYVSGTVTDSKGVPISGINVKITTRDGSAIDPTNVASRTVLADANGRYELKFYSGKNIRVELGDDTHICQSVDIDNVNTDVTQDFNLESGYSWLPGGFSEGTWVAEYGANKTWTSSEASASASEVTLPADKTLTYPLSNVLKPGDKIVVSATGASSVIVNNGFDETIQVSGGELEYTVWNSTQNLTITPVGDDLAISRIDYHLTDKSIVTYAGKVTKNSGADTFSGVHVYFSNGLQTVCETYTDVDGNYYLMMDSPVTGTIFYEYDHFLDQKVELASLTESKYAQNMDMVECVYLTGKVYQEVPGTGDFVLAPGVQITFEPADAYSWPIKTADDGTYLLKVKKGSSGSSWYYKEGWASFGYVFEDALDTDKELTDVQLVIAGATVSISSDTDKGHDHFRVDYYDQGYCYYTEEVVETEPLKFAENGKFSCGYDLEFNHILEYDFPGQQFHITLTPVASEGYSFWTWSYEDPDTHKTHVLADVTEEIGPLVQGKNYKFYTDYTLSTEITVGASISEGHMGWKYDCYVNDDPVPVSGILGPDENISFRFPISRQQSNGNEDIDSYYMFNGAEFEVVLNTEFISAESPDPYPYSERRVFTPIPADGYQLDAVAVNNADLLVNDKNEIVKDDPLDVMAKYSLILENVDAQTGDDVNMMWLVGLAILAMLGVAFGASRKQKGIRC